MNVNGKYECLVKRITLLEYLRQKGFKIERLAVLLNGEVIKKNDYDKIILSEADTIEVVCFVGGG